MAVRDDARVFQLLRRPDEHPGAAGVSERGRATFDASAARPQPAIARHVELVRAADAPPAASGTDYASISFATIRCQILKARAVCGNAARTDPHGGRRETG